MGDRNIVKWHFVTNRDNKATGLRGWDKRLEERYEMNETEDPGIYEVYVFDGENSSGDWLYSPVCKGALLDCMVAVEAFADLRFDARQETEDDDRW